MYEGGADDQPKEGADSEGSEKEEAPATFKEYFSFGNHAKLFKII
jgi:hypothetical protein